MLQPLQDQVDYACRLLLQTIEDNSNYAIDFAQKLLQLGLNFVSSTLKVSCLSLSPPQPLLISNPLPRSPSSLPSAKMPGGGRLGAAIACCA